MAHEQIIAVDLDGTLAHYDGWKGLDRIGDPIPGAKEFMIKLKALGKVMIYTTRCSLDAHREGKTKEQLEAIVAAWLKKNQIPYDYVWAGQGKPMAVCFIDDRAITCRPQIDDKAFDKAIQEAKLLLGKKS